MAAASITCAGVCVNGAHVEVLPGSPAAAAWDSDPDFLDNLGAGCAPADSEVASFLLADALGEASAEDWEDYGRWLDAQAELERERDWRECRAAAVEAELAALDHGFASCGCPRGA